MKIDGGCHCGNITFKAEVDPNLVIVCHCTDCQQITGTAYRVVVPVTKDAIEWKGGKPKQYVKTTADSGTPRVQGFCPECGTPLYSTSTGEQKVFGLRVGTIRQRAELKPQRQQWARSALGWAMDLRDMPQLPKQAG